MSDTVSDDDPVREHGYRCDRGVLYFAASRTRVEVQFTPELEARTFALIAQARQASRQRDYPPPLDDSPKCAGCSLGGICLPDETLTLQQVLDAMAGLIDKVPHAAKLEQLPGCRARFHPFGRRLHAQCYQIITTR